MDAFAGRGSTACVRSSKTNRRRIRLADFLRQEDQVFWDTARHGTPTPPWLCSQANGTGTTRREESGLPENRLPAAEQLAPICNS